MDAAQPLDMMDANTDFSSYGHPLTRWFGLPSFVTLEGMDDRVVDLDEASYLMSAFSTAADNARIIAPLFVPYGRNRPRDYLGYMIVPEQEAVIRFCCKAARPPAGREVTLRWLLGYFCERTGLPAGATRISVSVHCTWRAHINVHSGWQLPVAVAPGARHRECLWGPDADPVRMLELATTGQVLLENGLASLTPQNTLEAEGLAGAERCPRWTLLVELERDDPRKRRVQAPLAASFQCLLEAMNEAEGFVSVKQASEHRPVLATLTRSLLDASNIPSAEELNQMITEIFAADHPSVIFLDAVLKQRAVLPDVKSAPPLSLFTSLCMCLLNVEGLGAISVVWLEFVRELRWRWDHFEALPRTPATEPALHYCGVYQRLQMLNWCILQRRERNERAKGAAVVSKAALGGWSDAEPTEFESVSSGDDDKGDHDDNRKAASTALKTPEPINAREGVKEQTPLRLLQNGEQMCAPFTQDGQLFMTEDMLAEQQELLLSLGSDKQSSEMRAQMQSVSLLSDMEAFKAANPGCVLEDFVRWHSDKDWVVAAAQGSDGNGRQPDGSWVYVDERTGKRVCGRMSTRMAGAENLWQQTWAQARPLSAARQKPLVDHVREGERILHHLETLGPESLLRQCALVALSAIHHMFSQYPSSRVPRVSQHLSALAAAMIEVGNERANPNLATLGPEDLQPCLLALEKVERASAAAASMLFKLDNNVDLVNSLLTGARALVESEGDRAVVRNLFTEGAELPPPHGREFLIRTLSGSKSLVNRMYGMVTEEDDSVRICSALSTDDQ